MLGWLGQSAMTFGLPSGVPNPSVHGTSVVDQQ